MNQDVIDGVWLTMKTIVRQGAWRWYKLGDSPANYGWWTGDQALTRSTTRLWRVHSFNCPHFTLHVHTLRRNLPFTIAGRCKLDSGCLRLCLTWYQTAIHACIWHSLPEYQVHSRGIHPVTQSSNSTATQSLNSSGIQSLKSANPHSLNSSGTQSLNSFGTQSLNLTSTQSLKSASAQSLNSTSTQSLN